MSKIKNGGLDQYGAGPFEQHQFGTAGVEGFNVVTWANICLKLLTWAKCDSCVAKFRIILSCCYIAVDRKELKQPVEFQRHSEIGDVTLFQTSRGTAYYRIICLNFLHCVQDMGIPKRPRRDSKLSSSPPPEILGSFPNFQRLGGSRSQ